MGSTMGNKHSKKTDMSISALNTAFKQEIEDKEVNIQPLVSDGLPFASLLIEYESADLAFLDKLTLVQPLFKRYRKIRGDGNCFFRSAAFRLFEILCESADFASNLSVMEEKWTKLLVSAGFDKIAYEDFLESVIDQLKTFNEKSPIIEAAGEDSSDWLARQWRDDPIQSNTVMVLLRMLVSAHLQTNPDEYLPFIYEETSSTNLNPDTAMAEYCCRNVEAIGVESDHIDVIGLTRVLDCQIEIVYLDASPDPQNIVIQFGDASFFEKPISLLYRPGHYDIIYRE